MFRQTYHHCDLNGPVDVYDDGLPLGRGQLSVHYFDVRQGGILLRRRVQVGHLTLESAATPRDREVRVLHVDSDRWYTLVIRPLTETELEVLSLEREGMW